MNLILHIYLFVQSGSQYDVSDMDEKVVKFYTTIPQ